MDIYNKDAITTNIHNPRMPSFAVRRGVAKYDIVPDRIMPNNEPEISQKKSFNG